eukprot:364909-Chlamydomonas_euryale.AAC.2
MLTGWIDGWVDERGRVGWHARHAEQHALRRRTRACSRGCALEMRAGAGALAVRRFGRQALHKCACGPDPASGVLPPPHALPCSRGGGMQPRRTDRFLVRVEPLALGDHLAALCAVDVEWHLKANDEDALVQLGRAFAQRVLTIVLRRLVAVGWCSGCWPLCCGGWWQLVGAAGAGHCTVAVGGGWLVQRVLAIVLRRRRRVAVDWRPGTFLTRGA